MARPQHWTHDRTHFYKYVTLQTAKTILKNGTLRWSSPKLFNDPFDIQFDLHIEYREETIVEKILEEMWQSYSGNRSLLPDSMLGTGLVMLRNLNFSKDQFKSEFREAVKLSLTQGNDLLPDTQAESRKIICDTHVLCLSEIYDNILMWSHYAQNHTGIVLRLSCVEHLDSVWGAAQQVRYERKMPTLWDEKEFIEFMSGQRRLDTRETLEKALYSKAIDWAYEREWRLAGGQFSIEPYVDIPFDREELTGIYLGCRIARDSQEQILELARSNYPKASIFAGRKSEQSFSLEFLPLDSRS